ncbi:MAG: inositol monophosphatase [Chloroflexi bacterium]|nr:inositol monophosphatase [Chloroflexota bacterium]
MLNSILQTAIEIAQNAGAILKEHNGDRQITFKSEIDLVTDYDKRSEAYIVNALRQAFPDHALHGEEGTRINKGADYEWMIDPLDGTTNFAHSLPIFSVSLGLAHFGEPLLGVVYDPSREEIFSAIKDEGAHLNGKPIRVSTTSNLNHSLLVTGFPYDARINPDNNVKEFVQFTMRSQAVRRLGSAALDLCYVASGRFDGFWEKRINLWDVAAGTIIAREAGGVVTEANGESPIPHHCIVASNGLIHNEMMTVLRDGDNAPLP